MSIAENTIAYQVSIHRWGIVRKVPKSVLADLFPDERERKLVEGDVLKASKKIIESPEYDKIVSRDATALAWLKDHSVPSILKRGVYCIPTLICQDVDDYMEGYKDERKYALVDDFIQAYADQAEKAREQLGAALFSALEYPSQEQMPALFSVDTAYITFDVPQALKYVSEEYFRREQEKVEAQWREAEEAINQLLTHECLELVQGLQNAIQGLNDGTVKVFREANLVNLTEWGNLFLSARNVTNNAELAEVVTRIQDTLQGVKREDIKYDSGSIRQAVQKAMQGISVELKGMLVDEDRMVTLD